MFSRRSLRGRKKRPDREYKPKRRTSRINPRRKIHSRGVIQIHDVLPVESIVQVLDGLAARSDCARTARGGNWTASCSANLLRGASYIRDGGCPSVILNACWFDPDVLQNPYAY